MMVCKRPTDFQILNFDVGKKLSKLRGRKVIWTKYKIMHFFSGTLPLVLVRNDQKSRFVTESFQLRGSKDDGDNRFWGGCCAKSKFDFNYTFDNAEIYWMIFSSVPSRDIGIGVWEDLEGVDNKTLTHEIMEVCTQYTQWTGFPAAGQSLLWTNQTPWLLNGLGGSKQLLMCCWRSCNVTVRLVLSKTDVQLILILETNYDRDQRLFFLQWNSEWISH